LALTSHTDSHVAVSRLLVFTFFTRPPEVIDVICTTERRHKGE